MDIAKIDDDVVSAGELVKFLKLKGEFSDVCQQLVRHKLIVEAADKIGIEVLPDEVQKRADDFRRIHGLHRAKDTYKYLDTLGIGVDEWETYLRESLVQEKVLERICSKAAVEEYFALNSPQFDMVELSHMVLESEDKAREMLAYLTEDPDEFAEMARAHSLADTAKSGGTVGKVVRHMLPDEVQAKVFSADSGDLIGPFPSARGKLFEIFRVTAKHPAVLDGATETEVRRLIYERWFQQQLREHKVEIL